MYRRGKGEEGEKRAVVVSMTKFGTPLTPLNPLRPDPYHTLGRACAGLSTRVSSYVRDRKEGGGAEKPKSPWAHEALEDLVYRRVPRHHALLLLSLLPLGPLRCFTFCSSCVLTLQQSLLIAFTISASVTGDGVKLLGSASRSSLSFPKDRQEKCRPKREKGINQSEISGVRR